jgi:hypothetical protein
VTPRPTTPKPEEEIKIGTLGTVDPEIQPEENGEEINVGEESTNKKRKFMTKITEWFTGKDDEYTF